MAARDKALDAVRWALLVRLRRALELPMAVLGLVWLVLLAVELTRGLDPLLGAAVQLVWIAFVLDFLVAFALAPRKGLYLRKNWLTALALAVPALRVFRAAHAVRALRAARAVRGIRLFRLLASLNRGMRVLRSGLSRRGFGYVMALTALVALGGAAGMYALEKGAPGKGGFEDYGTALWWTAMILTTMGSENWPRTAEGRLLCLLLAVYAFAIFGYITAAVAAVFIGREAADAGKEDALAEELRALRREVAALRDSRGG